MDVEEYSWVKASEYRENILLAVEEKPRTPKELSEMNDYYLSHVSNVLSDLNSHGLAECITPKKKKGRLWAATGAGEAIVEDLKR
ncbi:transcriptional regulator [Haloarcula sp. CBA1130]|uniref:transcriptional regulator n=1 Tax=unclassified Haloarcula TaxID=2624677 RepID=UPI00124535AF|nr:MULTISPECIES: transcriptional regulator [unclassified Haloarcula]KAA9396668.1 transcriptional regulator [Haloarcula sp. CBA1130]KAA9397708.1 transcriptional regulator [Haloarcula sp. CBA1129]